MATWRGFIPASNQQLQYNSGADVNGADEVSISYSYKHATLPSFGATQSPLGILGGAAGGGDINVVWGIIYHEKDSGGEEWIQWQWTTAYATWVNRRKSFSDKLIWTTAPQNIVLTLKRSTGALRVWLGGSEMTDSNGTGTGFNAANCRRRGYSIGNRGDGANDFSGNIGRVTLWERLLTATEAQQISLGRDPSLPLYSANRIDCITMGVGAVASDNETSLQGNTYTQSNNPAVATVPAGLYTEFPRSGGAWHKIMGNPDE